MHDSQIAFNQLFADIDSTIVFDPAWKNGTGYYDGAVRADLNLKPGERVKFEDDIDRRGIIIGTRFGNVVVFERYSAEGDTRSSTITHNSPSKVEHFVSSASLQSNDIYRIIGDNHLNIGTDIEHLFN